MIKKKKYDRGKNNNRDLENIKNKLEDLKSKTEVTDEKIDIVKKNVDPFNDLKIHILNVLDETRKYIREKESIQNIHGNNIEVIKRGNIIYNNIKNLDTYFIKLEEILTKQLKQKYLFSKEELLDKSQSCDLLKKQIYECKKLSNFDHIKETCAINFDDFKNKPQIDRKETSNIKHEEDDLIIINRWKKRDEKFNEEILKIGEVIDIIGANADFITQKAEEQNEIILNLQDQTDKTQDNVKEINVEIKKVMRKHSHTTWCCRISLVIIFIMLVLITSSVISNKFIKNL
ncbi:hypothetical protein MKS88_005144 [Plasmodium brasilianum]|uniref:t-SNARE coiled-coil homology domain-containing protein n=2 Tax=Plasmodium (Plasmodium) TaxID=418103 RepID=A0A1C3KFR8_PLAMA|nr:conserved Plasmodium protein, unknown function [Plasmodium malariae]KAI4835926.1 hypothetical protein MKS88_005144 [Plasmodium brasilianum]SBT72512.1 conserved Plasmodium protein, unknown function [Plasmodium malariae]SCP02863.1 conserved Plasmodium protein, unknown function [Plasmodium malariae]